MEQNPVSVSCCGWACLISSLGSQALCDGCQGEGTHPLHPLSQGWALFKAWNKSAAGHWGVCAAHCLSAAITALSCPHPSLSFSRPINELIGGSESGCWAKTPCAPLSPQSPEFQPSLPSYRHLSILRARGESQQGGKWLFRRLCLGFTSKVGWGVFLSPSSPLWCAEGWREFLGFPAWIRAWHQLLSRQNSACAHLGALI